ncbi:hypothetical protein pipiens_009854 [Culex pipiens pipiens]|uniref:LRRCT domain-containing protein n=1 Tax=Culex pipiens pipiens TaxID=38569 RepID=A0ABD1DCP1_CULPP
MTRCCRRRRKRCLPIVFCVVCFSILILWVLGDIYQKRISFYGNSTYNFSAYDPVEFDFSNASDGRSLLLPASSDERYCSVVSSCKIYCRCMDLDGLSFKIDSLLEVDPCGEIELIIEMLQILDRRLFRGWISLSSDVVITNLELKNSNITEIPPETFDSSCIHDLTVLTVDSLEVTRLEANVFLGLKRLKELNLKNLKLKVIEPFVLAPIKFTLSSLLVEGCLDLVNPRPFTGSTTVDHLEIVSFEFNVFEDVISDDAFAMVPKVSSLYLRNSRITVITKRMIDSVASSIKQIHLVGNELQTIEVGVFDELVGRGVKLHLGNNPWVCDCNLSYLKELIVANKDMFDEIKCEEPPEYNGMLLTEASFCATSTITPTEETSPDQTTLDDTTDPTESSYRPTLPTINPTGTPTDKTTELPPVPTIPPTAGPPSGPTDPILPDDPSTPPISTPAPPSNVINMNCISTTITLQANVSPVALAEDDTFAIRRRTKTFSVFESQEGAVEIVLDQSYPNTVILWFYDTASSNAIFTLNIEEGASCADIYGRVVRISNLIPDKTYLFCVIYKFEVTISPFDCLPYKLQPSYGQRTWMVEDQKTIVISILIASVAVAVMTGIALTYCFIRSFTSYQKACAKTRPMDLRHIDKSTTNQCYMSPVVEKPERARHKRSVSESSMESGRSYVSAVVPATQFQYISWKMENHPAPQPPQQSSRRAEQGDFYPKDPPPPPLPPHPVNGGKRRSGGSRQKSEIKINFHEIYDEPSSSYTDSPPQPPPLPKHPGRY